MVPGFNTDFKYRGQTFHVQTEDNGVANPVVVSLLYHKGAILASRRTSYRELLEKPDCTEQLKEMMKSQHKALMRELLAGAYDAKIPGAAASAAAVSLPASPPEAAAATPSSLVAAAPPPVAAGPAAAVQASRPPAVEAPHADHALPQRRQQPALRPAPAALATSTRPVAARPPKGHCGSGPAASLDEAIMRYLKEHAAAAAAAR